MLESLDTISGYRAPEIAMLRDSIRANALLPSPGVVVNRTPSGTTISIESAPPTSSTVGYPYGSEWLFGFEWNPSDGIAVADGHSVLRIHNAEMFGVDWSLAITPNNDETGTWDVDIDPSTEVWIGALVNDGVSTMTPNTAESLDALNALASDGGWMLVVAYISHGVLVRDYVHGRVALPIWSWRSNPYTVVQP